MNNFKPIICKDLHELIERKLNHDVNYLIGLYFDNDKENEIKRAINSKDLIEYYRLRNTSHENRYICPFHPNADNPTSFEFDDTKGAFRCHACGVHGTYIKFIVMMENFTDNPYAEAKILAANNFANMPLGFASISDFKNQIRQLVIERYNKTKSLLLNDYFDISLIGPMPTMSIKHLRSEPAKVTPSTHTKNTPPSVAEKKSKEFKLRTLDLEKVIRDINADDVINYGDFKYRIDLGIAKKSKLIKGFENNPTLNSRETLYEFMHKKYDISPQVADKYGLIAFKKENQSLLEYPDFFMINDRVLFPFTDHNTGITVGYQARIMDLDRKNTAKYLNISDFGDIVIKKVRPYRDLSRFGIGNFLFNLYQLRDKNIDRLFITEGVTDAIKLLSLDYDCISPGQPNLTDHQIYLINKYFGKKIELIIFYDNDTNN
ncbi:CHC2 zinc finger [Acetoanaerobium noterae]|uniref:CHC2 zinc finger n=1 Tax=Acetoanaerobium noterae TaxID=745369 RepID=A0A1T5DMS7_9FIRM|nr:CHC2 zinc finger domain-containing protein [Acetoanaerobium noterae]SKB72890.1 CHC2 zinc finger [Acetoanaerobium noterae]